MAGGKLNLHRIATRAIVTQWSAAFVTTIGIIRISKLICNSCAFIGIVDGNVIIGTRILTFIPLYVCAALCVCAALYN